METGNNISSSLIKTDYSLQPDNDQDLAGNGQKSFVDFSRNGLQVLRINSKFKAVLFNSFNFPHCADDQRWCDFVRQILNSEDFTKAVEGSEVDYSIWDNKVTVIPKALYTEDMAQANFKLLFGGTYSEGIQSQELSSQDSIGIHAIPNKLESIISQPISNSFLHWLNSVSNQTGIVANLVISESVFGLIIQKDDALLFTNWFEIKKAEDVLYFTMATLETLNILHSEVKIVLSGDVEKNDSVHLTIGKFISNISFGNRPKNLEYAYSFKDLPNHKFPFIFSTSCA